MNQRTFANKYRPKKFTDVVGQEAEVEVLKQIVGGVWVPPAILFAGPWGTGKTSLARLSSMAMLCKNRQGGVEPCGYCESCKAMDSDSHSAYTELDAASNNSVEKAREIKDILEYRSGGDLRIIVFDESHMLTQQAQNALLKILEEGRQGVVMMFATTERKNMLSTIASRCIELDLKLLTAAKIGERLRAIVRAEGADVEDKAIRIVATYVRGHLRDAIMLLEQLIKMGKDGVTEALTRTYLRLDRNIAIYEFLNLKDRKAQLVKLEELLCSYSPQELQELMGEAILNAYKVKLGVGEFAEVDEAWLKKVAFLHGDTLLKKADQTLSLNVDFATINHACAAFAKVFAEDVLIASGPVEGTSLVPQFRKPKVEGAV